MRYATFIPTLLISCLLVGCRVGPDHVVPETNPPATFADAGGGGDSTRTPDDAWWRSFADPTLTACVEEALRANHDLRAAQERVRIARAMRRMDSSRFHPQVDGRVAYTVDRLSANNPRFQDAVEAGFFPRDVEYWNAGFDVTWELDVFGGTRRRVEGAVARIEEEQFRRRALMLSVAAEVARTYFELRGNQARLGLNREQVTTGEGRTRILQARQEAGLLPGSRVRQSEAQVEGQRAMAPGMEAEIEAARYRLAVLMGRRPTDRVPGLEEAAALPRAEGRVPVGLPSDLLLRRPDLLSVERQLAAATADIGVAKAQFFPRFFLTGSPNLQSGDFTDLFSGASSAWTFGPSVQWRLFAGGRNQAQLEAARARNAQVLIEYEATVNRVLQEVETSLSRYGRGAVALQHLARATASLQRDRDARALRAQSGLTGKLEVLEARTAWLNARTAEVTQRVVLLNHLVSLHKALGGGWESAEALAAVNPTEPADAAASARERE
jgi:NodT family efflux transporter outer membrane factor (OMF) lipoprotein